MPEEPGGQEPKENQEPKGGEQTPPWGSDENFDAQRAWKLIEDLRTEKGTLKSDRDELRTKVQQHEDASKTEQQRAADKATTAEQRAVAAEQKALQLDVALANAPEGMPVAQIRKLAKRLTGTTQEELEADAAELFADFTPAGGGDDDTRRRPQERLRSGAAPSSQPEETDPAKLAAQVPRMY